MAPLFLVAPGHGIVMCKPCAPAPRLHACRMCPGATRACQVAYGWFVASAGAALLGKVTHSLRRPEVRHVPERIPLRLRAGRLLGGRDQARRVEARHNHRGGSGRGEQQGSSDHRPARLRHGGLGRAHGGAHRGADHEARGRGHERADSQAEDLRAAGRIISLGLLAADASHRRRFPCSSCRPSDRSARRPPAA